MEDEKIIALFEMRSERALTELDTKYGKVCRNVSHNILHCDEDVEECVNDAYLGVWNAIPPEHPNPLVTFVCRIVRNISLSRYAHRKAQKRCSAHDLCLHELDECVPAPDTVEASLDATELTRYIDEFLDTLGSTDRIAFVRRYWFFDDYPALAHRLGMTQGAVRVRLTRVRKRLKAFLEQRGVVI